MAEQKTDCTELAASIANAAFIIADGQSNPTLSTVTREMQQRLQAAASDVRIDRQIVMDSINDFTAQERSKAKESLITGAGAIRQEAAQDEKLRGDIKRLERDIARGFFEGPANRTKRRVSEEIAALQRRRKSLATEEKIDRQMRREIERAEKILGSGDFESKGRPATRPDIRSTARLRTEKEAVQKEVRRRRAEQRAVKSLNERIKDMEQQIATKEFKDAPKKKQAQASKLVQDLRNKHDRLAQEVRLRKSIDKFTKQLKGIDPIDGPATRSPRFSDPELINLQAKKKLLRNQVNSVIRDKKPLSPLEFVGEAGNISRTMLTIADLSATLRQGGKLGLANPSLIAKNFGPSLRAFANAEFAAEVDVMIRNNPNAWMYDVGKLHISDPSSSLSNQEEFFMRRNFIDKVPVIGSLVRGSERSFTTFLNLMRSQSFDRMVKGTRNGSPTVEEMRAIGNAINILTGRGDLGKLGNAAAPLLNQFFFAPRYVASQFQTLTLNPLRKATPGAVRRQVRNIYARMLINFGLLAVLADMAGFDIEYDARSSDFLKFRKDRTRIDMGTGLLQPIVLMTRLGKGESKSPVTGRITQLRGEDQDFGASGFETFSRFARSKLNPLAGMAVDLIMDGENVIGDTVNVTTVEGSLNLAKNQLVPISMQEIAEILLEGEDMDDAAVFMLLSILGAGVSTFDKRESAPQRR